MNIRSLFLDFGGCIDAPGIHTRTLFWEAFLTAGLVDPEERARFQDAYSEADQRMMASGEAKGMALRPFNRHNGALIAASLGLSPEAGADASEPITQGMAREFARNRPVLEALGEKARLGIISNFTGNLPVILEEFSLRSLFASVTESFYVGCSKPAERIFREALALQPFPAAECLYVGDNPVNDIAPAKKLGMKSVLIHGPGARRDCGADAYIEDLRELLDLIHNR